MLKRNYIYLALLLLVIFTTCSIEEPGQNNPAGANGFTLKYAIDYDLSTKSQVEAEKYEDHIQSIFIFFFEYTTDQSGKLLNIYNVPVEKEKLSGNFGNIFIDFTHSDYYNLDASTDYNLLITANTEYYTRVNNPEITGIDLDAMREHFLRIWGHLTEKQIAQNAYIRLDRGEIIPGRLPMSGKATKAAASHEVEVMLSRCVSRIDIVNEDKRYELVSAGVWNVFSRMNLWDNTTATYTDDDFVKLPVVKAIDNAVYGQLYAFENYVASPEENDQVTTCAIIGLRRIGEAQENNIEYYRVNINPSNYMQRLKRNHVYCFRIKQVLGDGKSTQEDAYKSGESMLEGSLNGWQDENTVSIVYDDENVLAVSFSTISFRPEGGEAALDIFTRGPGTPQVLNTSLPENITIQPVENNKLVVTATPSSQDQNGEIEITLRKLKLTIRVEQRGGDKEEIRLSHKQLDMFPPVANELYTPPSIKVTATGSWTARLYNNPENETGTYKFSLAEDNSIQEVSSDNPEDYVKIYLNTNNTGNEAVYSFIIFSLDSNPTISQVLLLTQRTGRITLSDTELAFTPDGKTTGDITKDYYDVRVETGFDWDMEVMHGEDFFVCEKVSDNILRISATPDTKGVKKESVLRVHVTEDPRLFEEITVSQAAHTLTLNPSGNLPFIKPGGGKTAWITVHSTGPWTATVKALGNKATLVRAKEGGGQSEESDTQLSGNPGDKFLVSFPEVTLPNIEPVATITIKIDDTSVQKELVVRQEALKGRIVCLDSWGDNNIGLNTNTGISLLSRNLRHPELFGPTGIVQMGGIHFSGKLFTEPSIEAKADIYQTGIGNAQDTQEMITEAHAIKIKEWLSAVTHRIYFFLQTKKGSSSIANLKSKGVISDKYVAGEGTFVGLQEVRFDNTENKLMQFLLKEGPFTVDDPIKNIVIKSYASSMKTLTYLTDWPETFVPILVSPPKRCWFGIDPVERFVFMGDYDIVSSANYWYGIYGEDDNLRKQKYQLLNNAFAWIMYAAMYGEDFLDQFR